MRENDPLKHTPMCELDRDNKAAKCPLCNDTGEQRYWEGRWRDEAKENERLKEALTIALRALDERKAMICEHPESVRIAACNLRCPLCMEEKVMARDYQVEALELECAALQRSNTLKRDVINTLQAENKELRDTLAVCRAELERANCPVVDERNDT